ncbi:MAG: DUF2118 domain-containing protein, partial [Brevundimonas sp.]
MGRFVFKLPDVGEGTAEAELVAWKVAVGDAVAEDQIVAEVMTDKATVEITSPVDGVVTTLHGEAGAMVPVRGPLVEFEVDGAGNAEAEAVPPPVAAKPAPKPEPAKPAPAPAKAAAPVAAGGNYVFKLPDVGEGTAEAELVGWHVKVGDRVEEDQILADVMTDKATVEITSPVAGVVIALHGEAGQQSPVGGPLVTFAVEGAGNAQAAAPVEAPSTASRSPSPNGGGSDEAAVAPTQSPPLGGSTRA